MVQQLQQWFDEGKYAEVLVSIQNKFPEESMNTEIRQLKAYTLQKTGNFEAAMLQWNQLIAVNPNNSNYYLERGVCKFNLKFKHAMDDFNQALSLEPENAYYHAAKAFLLDKQGQIEEAIVHYEKSIELDPENEITINNLAIAEQKRGNKPRADELFKATDDLLKSKGLYFESPRPEISEITSIPPVEESPRPKPSIWKEIKKMFSSRDEFGNFLKEVKTIYRKSQK